MQSPRFLTRFASAPKISKEDQIGDMELKLSKSYLDKKHEKGVFSAILFNKNDSTLGVYPIKHERISTFPNLLNFLTYLYRGQGHLLKKFEKYPQILLMIFQKQLEEIDRFIVEGFKSNLGPTNENTTSVINFGRKVYYLVSRINLLKVRLHESTSDLVPKKMLELFPDLKVLSYIPHSDSKACGNILLFLETEKCSKLWQLFDRPDLYQYCCPEDNSFSLATKLTQLTETEQKQLQYLDIDSLAQGFSQLKLNKEDAKEFGDKLSKFTALSHIKLGKKCHPAFNSHLLKCLNSTKAKLHANFSGSGITDTDLLFMKPKITVLNLSQTSVDGTFLCGSLVANLEILKLSQCKNFDESKFQLASVGPVQERGKGKIFNQKKSSTLRELDVSWTKVTGKCFFSPIITGVTTLNMEGCSVDEIALKQLREKKLVKINFNDTGLLGDCLSGPLFKTIRHLSVANCLSLKEDALENLSAKNLTYLNISGAKVNGIFFKKLQAPYLSELILRSCSNLEDKYLKNVVGPITNLDLQGTNITGDCFEAFKYIEELNLRNCPNLNEEHLLKLPLDKLKKLDLSRTKITGKFFTNMPLLEELSLTGCINLKEEYFSKLLAPKLKILNLKDTSFTGSVLSDPLFQLIEELCVEGTKVTDENLQNIAKSKEKTFGLKTLKASDTSLTGAFLSNPCFQKIEVIELLKCPKFDVDAVPESLKSIVVTDINIESFEFV